MPNGGGTQGRAAPVATPHGRIVPQAPPIEKAGRSSPLEGGVLDLQPIPASTARVQTAQPFRHDPFKPELARVREHGSAVSLDNLAKPNHVDSRGERLQLCASDFKRELAPVLALKLDQKW
jgi:hypothetical protein